MLKAPFPYFGGKSKIAPKVWQLLGNPKMYIEPFFGSGAVLLNRPPFNDLRYEIINDKDGFIANVWRALQFNPDEVAKWCDWPCNHADLTARRKKLIASEAELLKNLVNDDMFYDAKLAGYWIWGASNWIGGGLTRSTTSPHLTHNREINQQIPHLTGNQGVNSCNTIYDWFKVLSNRLRNVKVVCGDWTRVCGGNWQDNSSPVGIYFDPPYSDDAKRNNSLYHCESTEVAHDVVKWALERGQNKNYRIVISGYITEHNELIENGWNVLQWKAGSCWSNGTNNNRKKEALFYSPYCNQINMLLKESKEELVDEA